MRRQSSPGFLEWVFVTLTLLGTFFLLNRLYTYAGQRTLFPTGLLVANIDASGRTAEELESLLIKQYQATPVTVYHKEQPIEIYPSDIEFSLDLEGLMAEAYAQRDQQDFWAGFWGYLWGRPIDVDSVELTDEMYAFNESEMNAKIDVIAQQFDTPSLPAKTAADTLSFEQGDIGLKTDISASKLLFRDAFIDPDERDVYLLLVDESAESPTIDTLDSMLNVMIKSFEQQSASKASVFVHDMSTTQPREIGYNANLPMSGMSLMRIPIMFELVRVPATNSAEIEILLGELAVSLDDAVADQALSIIGNENIEQGANLVTQSMTRIGLYNTFLGCPYDTEGARCTAYKTSANQDIGTTVIPDEYRQTTAEDIGTLLLMLYECAIDRSGALLVVYPDTLSPTDCEMVLQALEQNRIGSLIEEGVPPNTVVAHRHDWENDTYGDAGIIYSPNGDYILVEFVHKPGWDAFSVWEIVSPLMADISQAVYNYINLDQQYRALR